MIGKDKILIIILTLAFLLRFIGLMPNIDHPDEGYVQIKSWNLVKNVITKGDFNPHTFKYGSLFFYYQALTAFPILYTNYFLSNLNVLLSSSFTSKALDFSLFHEEAVRKFSNVLTWAGRAEVALLGFLSILLLYLIGKKLFNREVGLLAAFFLAISPLHVRDSHYITTDIPLIFFILLAFYFLILVWQDKKLKWFILSGLFLGLGSTVRYFPIAYLAYPIVLIFSFEKRRPWLLKVFLSAVFIIIGIFLGVPFLFLDPHGPALFSGDMEKYVLPWYSTSLTNFIFTLGKEPVQLTALLPQYFRPFYSAQFFFFGLGPLLSLISIFGIIAVFLVSKKKLLLILIIPLLTFIYISSYIPSSYERLVIPIIPFMAIFAAFFVHLLFEKSRKLHVKIKPFFIGGIFLVLVLQPFVISLSAVASCSRKTVQKESSEWIDQNIKDQAKIGYVTLISFPSTRNFAEYKPLEPDREISLEEARSLNLDHAFLNGNRLDYVSYPFFVNFFFPGNELYENSYYHLVLKEYMSRAKLLKKLDKPFMCDSHRIFYFKLPEKLEQQKNLIKDNNFEWSIQPFGKNDSNLKSTEATLIFEQKNVNFTPPRLYSNKILINEEEIYTFSARIKSTDSARVFLRMDFYTPKEQSLNTGAQKTVGEIKKRWLLFWEGSTPVYYEKKILQEKFFDNQRLPGEVIALSPRIKLNSEWQEIFITAKAPQDSKYVILSIQNTNTNKSTINISNAKFLGQL